MSLENVIKDLKSKIDSDQHYVDKLKKDIELLKHESEKVILPLFRPKCRIVVGKVDSLFL